MVEGTKEGQTQNWRLDIWSSTILDASVRVFIAEINI